MAIETKLKHLLEIARDPLASKLLPGYAACLTLPELCDGVYASLEYEQQPVRRSLLTRLLRLLRQESHRDHKKVAELVAKLLHAKRDRASIRVRVNSILSQLYSSLPVDVRKSLITSWQDEGTRGSYGRWLKAIASDKTFFNDTEIASYWRREHDSRAGKLIAYKCSPELVTELLNDLFSIVMSVRVACCAGGDTRVRSLPRRFSAIKREVPSQLRVRLRNDRPSDSAGGCCRTRYDFDSMRTSTKSDRRLSCGRRGLAASLASKCEYRREETYKERRVLGQ
jgi:hypothetical protein